MAAKKKATAKKSVAKKTPASRAAAKKSAAKKTSAKKTAAKKTATRKTAAKKTASRGSNSGKPPSKSEIMATIAEKTELSRKEVASVFDALGELIQKNIKLPPRGPGQFSVPGLMKITVTEKPATKARKGINPFTGEETMFKAKPKSKVVKVRPLKNLKDMA